MTKSIEQIALETFDELEQPYGDLDTPAIGKENIAYFLSRCLAKIGEGLEPVASFVVGDATAKYGSKRDLVEQTNDDTGYWKNRGYHLEPLYTTPHEAIIAAEQRVAEACAKLVEKQAEIGIALHQISIRSGEWRKYK